MSQFNKHFALFALAACTFASATSVARAQSVNLTQNEAPATGFGAFGAVPTFGQTFVAPSGVATLQSFNFWLSNQEGSLTIAAGNIRFNAYLMSWDPTTNHAVGPVLFSSTMQVGPTVASQIYTFNANAAVTANSSYVAFLSVSPYLGTIVPDPTLGTAFAAMEATESGTYTGGQLVYTDNGGDLSLLSSKAWDNTTGGPESQSRFLATFAPAAVTSVPEPSSLLLMVAGLSLVAFVAMKRKRV